MRSIGRGIGAVAVIGALALALSSTAAANTFQVTRRDDPPPTGCHANDCSLREAIRAANFHAGTDKVVLPKAKPYNLSIANTTGGEDAALEGDLDVTGPLTVLHPGPGRATVDAHAIDRVFDVFAGAPTRFQKLVIRGGAHPTSDGFGGGIRSDANLVVTRTIVTHNHADSKDGGGIAFPQGDASLTMERSALTANISGDDGGGLSFNKTGTGHLLIDRSKIVGNESDGFGGGFISAVTGRITRSTISGNRADNGSAGGGDFEIPDNNVINRSTFSGNTAPTGNGGGLVLSDGADGNKLTDVTIASNHAGGEGGGLYVADASAKLNALTVARNSSAGSGGGLFSGTSGPFELLNSLIVLNHGAVGADCANDPGDDFDSLGHNLLTTLADCDGFNGPADIVRGDPKIGTLGKHGGPTKTIPLKKGSPAIGHAGRSSAPPRDQRGHKRDRHPDAGAFER